MLFLLVPTGLVTLVFALARSGTVFVLGNRPDAWFGLVLAEFWVGRSLALGALTPPLLVALGPLLLGRGSGPQLVDDHYVSQHGPITVTHTSRGDWIEIVGLAIGAGLLSLLLCLGTGVRDADSWQLWGPPLLLIVWASVRQGVLGGSLAAGAAATLPLLVLSSANVTPRLLLLEANLLAECAAALLVAVSSTWIRMSEARYRRIVGHVPVVLYSARLVGQPVRAPGSSREADRSQPRAEITLVSAASLGLLGCVPEQLLGDYENWVKRIHPQDKEIVLAAVNQLARQQQPVSCEYRLLAVSAIHGVPNNPHGTEPPPVRPSRSWGRWVRDTMAPQFDTSNRLVGWEGVMIDVTEQRALADDLRRTTSMFHTLIANLPAGVVFVQGNAGRPVLVNARARQLLGRREELGVGIDNFPAFFHLQKPDGSLYPVNELPVAEALRRGQAASSDDMHVVRTDGQRVPLITWAAPVDLGDQGRDAAVWVLEDLTDLRHSEQTMRQSEEKYRGLVESLPFLVIQVNQKGRCVYANPATRQRSGSDLETYADPEQWERLVLPEFRERVQAMGAESMAGRPSRGELRFRAKDGSELALFVANQPVREGDTFVGCTSVMLELGEPR